MAWNTKHLNISFFSQKLAREAQKALLIIEPVFVNNSTCDDEGFTGLLFLNGKNKVHELELG